MTHDVIKHLLDDYVMGDVDEEARAPVAEHVAACDECRAEVEWLKEIKERSEALPREIDPPTDAWSTIRATIERDRESVTRNRSSRMWQWQRPVGIAAAVLFSAVLSSAGTYWYLRDHSAITPATAIPDGTPATLAAFTVEENNYLRTAAALQDLLDQQENAMAPETVAQLKTSLRTIDEAILEARNALARDPANRMLIQMLSVTYRQKVDLLRRTTELTRGT